MAGSTLWTGGALSPDGTTWVFDSTFYTYILHLHFFYEIGPWRGFKNSRMAPDNTYYIRAGAHSVPADHYIVEALFARRRVTRPSLIHTFRFKPDCAQIIQLGIVALSDEPALDVSLTLDPLPTLAKENGIPFPRVLPLVDKANSFFMDLVLAGFHKRDLGENVQVRLEYQDTAGNKYPYAAILDLEKAYVPWIWGTEATERIARAAETLDATMKDFLKAAKRTGESPPPPRAPAAP